MSFARKIASVTGSFVNNQEVTHLAQAMKSSQKTVTTNKLLRIQDVICKKNGSVTGSFVNNPEVTHKLKFQTSPDEWFHFS